MTGVQTCALPIWNYNFHMFFWSGLNQKMMSTTAFEALAVPTKKPTRRSTKMPRTRKPEFTPSTAPTQEPTSVLASSYNRRPQYHVFVSTNPSVLWFQPEYDCVTDEFIKFHSKSTYVCRCHIDIFQNIKYRVLQSQSLWLPITPPCICHPLGRGCFTGKKPDGMDWGFEPNEWGSNGQS